MTLSEAYIIAENYIKSENAALIETNCWFIYGVGEPTEFTGCFYFDFQLLDPDGSEYTGEPVCGAPGFIVSKVDGIAKIVSYSEWSDLIREEKRMDDLFTLLCNVKEKEGDLFKIKSIYNLNSKEILLFRNALQQESFDRYTVTGKLQEILQKIKS